MDRKMYQCISQLIKDKPEQTSSRPLSQLGRQVLEHYYCGYIRNNRLIFGAEDKRRLRQQVSEELGLDPFTIKQLPAGRLEMAKFHPNEKLAAKPVSDDHLLLNSPNGIFRLNGQCINLQPELIPAVGMFCLNSGIQSIEHDAIVVVENLAMMQVCGELDMPPLARRALWVYRGDYKSGAKVNTCHDFVRRLGTNLPIIVFSDMDPKGLEIALTMPSVNYWLGPETDSWPAMLRHHQANRIGFDTQSEAMGYLQRSLDSDVLSVSFKRLISVMRDERSSFRQEHTYAYKARLELLPIREKDDSSISPN